MLNFRKNFNKGKARYYKSAVLKFANGSLDQQTFFDILLSGFDVKFTKQPVAC